MRVFTKYFRKGRLALVLGLVAVGSVSAVALADVLWADGDDLATNGRNNDLAFGSVNCGQEATDGIPIVLERTEGGANMFKNGTNATITVDSVTGAGLSAANPGQIPIPGDWKDQAHGSFTDSVTATVRLTSTTAGPGSGTVTFKATGVNQANGSALTRTDSVGVSWTTGNCSTPDVTDPTSSATASGGYAFGDWTNQNVSVTLTGSDPAGAANETVSGLKEIRYTTDGSTPTASDDKAQSGDTVLFDSEGQHTLKFVAVDNAGNIEDTVQSRSIKIDKTAPSITDEGPTATPTGINSWYKVNVVNEFRATDSLSGLDAGCDAAFDQADDVKQVTISAEGLSQTGASGGCSDNAGNSADPVTSAAFKIDKTVPTSEVVGFVANAIYILGATLPAPSCDGSDATSGIRLDGQGNEIGGTLDETASLTGNGVGTASFRCNGAEDNAGHVQTTPSVVKSYSVQYARHGGILQPINADGNSVFSQKRAVPVKFQLGGDEPNGFDTSAWTLKRANAECGSESWTPETATEAGTTSANTGLRYDAAADQYIANATLGGATLGQCYRFVVGLDDGTTIVSPKFKVGK